MLGIFRARYPGPFLAFFNHRKHFCHAIAGELVFIRLTRIKFDLARDGAGHAG
jgi:hypothetical protein